jgi:hypothetical protein
MLTLEFGIYSIRIMAGTQADIFVFFLSSLR